MAVTGTVHPKRVLTNAGGKAGDLLILTKPIGTGIATTAMKRDKAPKALERQVIAQMATLNKAAGEVFANPKLKVHALTDVTGFGLLGHLLEMARGAKLKAVLDLPSVPLLPGIAQLSEEGVVPGGTKTNLEHVSKGVRFPEGLPLSVQHVLADAQTNGGLLAAVAPKDAAKALKALEKKRVEGFVIGQLQRGRPGIDVLV